MFEEPNESLKVDIRLADGASAPTYQTTDSAGMDLRAFLPDEEICLTPGEFRLIPTGIFIALPKGTEAQVRPRSGLAFKYGVTVLNSPGTIDADYRGEVGVLLINHGKEDFIIKNGDRIAQMVIASYVQVNWNKVADLNQTRRGEGGFGSTGKN
jgi:dUTP pyrophosphatase